MIRPAEPRTPGGAVTALVLVVGVVGLVTSGCSGSGSSADTQVALSSSLIGSSLPTQTGTAAVIPTPVVPTPATPIRGVPTVVPAETVSPSPATVIRAVRNRVPALDRLAGLRTKKVAWSARGRFRVVPGKSVAPGKGRVHRIKVEVEVGLNVDRTAFANYVMATLNDKRSWGENGRRRFVRTAGAADIRVLLGSPATTEALCRPLRTFGKLSCRQGKAAVLTLYRWTKASPEYAGNHDGYRHYLINHEVGHTLGHRHAYCPGRGRMAPVMMQQTKGLRGCKPNSWPHP